MEIEKGSAAHTILEMDTGTVGFFRRTFDTILGIPQILTRLLNKPETLDADPESQAHWSPYAFEDEILPRVVSDDPRLHQEMPDHHIEDQSYSKAIEEGPGVEESHKHVPNVEGESYPMPQKDSSPKQCFTILVNQDILSAFQKVINDRQTLRAHELRYSELVHQMSHAERLVEKAREKFEIAEDEERRIFQHDLEQREADLQRFCNKKDIVEDRLEIFRMNPSFAKDQSQDLIEKTLSNEQLLGVSETSEPAGSNYDTSFCAQSSAASSRSSNESSAPNPEDLFRQAAWEDLTRQSQELQETQEQFDNWPAVCEQEREAHDNLLASGQEVPTRSELDVFLLHQGMRITTHFINVEKLYENAKEHAKAVGVVDEFWGGPVHYGDEFEAQSCTEEEAITYQKSRDWSRIEDWMQSVSLALNANGNAPDVEEQFMDQNELVSMELDDCDNISVSPEDSHSVIAHDEYMGKNIKRWQAITGRR